MAARPLLLLATLALLAGCTTTTKEAAQTETTSSSDEATDLAGGEPYAFSTDILDEGYQHTRLDAFPQATIVWRNAGDQTHSIVSDDGAFAGSGPITPGAAFATTFLAPGDFGFHCRYHPEMKGLVVVR